MTLVDDADSVLVVIDAQPGFLDKLEPGNAEDVVDRIRWLVELAAALEIPVVATEEDPGGNGGTAAPIAEALPAGVEPHVKPVFGLAACPPIVEDLERHGRRTAVLCGLETDVCVSQSAIGLVEAGWRVVVVEDAVGAPGAAHAQGIARMAADRVELLGLKGLAFEWLRTVERADRVGPLLANEPRGITL